MGALLGDGDRDLPYVPWQPGDSWFAAMQPNSGSKPPAEFKSGRTRRRSGAVFQIRKLSNKLSTHDRAHSANHQLSRQVHQGHVLTL